MLNTKYLNKNQYFVIILNTLMSNANHVIVGSVIYENRVSLHKQ